MIRTESNRERLTEFLHPSEDRVRNCLRFMRAAAIQCGMTLFLFASFLIIGCKGDSTDPDEPRNLAGITDLKAHTENQSTIILTWTPSADEGLNEMEGYRVLLKLLNGAIIRTTDIDKGSDGLAVTGLLEGNIYSFEVSSMPVSGSELFRQSIPSTIRWSPARRLTTDNLNQPIRVYESTSLLNSGLILFDTGSSKPKLVSIANPGLDSLSIDLYATSDTNNSITLRSAHLFNPGWRETRFSVFANLGASLNDPRAVPLDTSTYTQTTARMDSGVSSSSLILYFKTQNAHYGRILIQRNSTNGQLVRGSSPDQYLEISISYQTIARNPYARSWYAVSTEPNVP